MDVARGPLKDEDKRLWSLVTATVRPHTPKKARPTPPASKPQPETETLTLKGMPPGKDTLVARKPEIAPLTPFTLGQALIPQSGKSLVFYSNRPEPDAIEPNRKRRLSRERDPIEARLDLHGLNAFAAEARLKAFVQQAFQNDFRAILVITGKGVAETGLLKRLAPEWLSDPALSHMVAGISQAHARHGGTGALYVALKRRPA